jgi:hypothetical protein
LFQKGQPVVAQLSWTQNVYNWKCKHWMERWG